jgi:erythromycin esterase-like protein
VRPALAESYERAFHDTGIRDFFLDFRNGAEDAPLFQEERLERAIGVIYRPESERVSHYFHASMPHQFDGVYHFDETRAVEPLEKPERWHDIEPPETFPSGI